MFQNILHTRESIDKRDQTSPINWLISCAVLNSIICIVLIFCLDGITAPTVTLSAAYLFYILVGYGRQIIILLVMLIEIAKVNEVHDNMIEAIAKVSWKDMETEKLSLYIALKEYPIGSTMFFYRPSKIQLMLQMASAVLSVLFAIFWAFVFK